MATGYKDDLDEKQAGDTQYDLSSEARRRQKEAAALDEMEKNYNGSTADSSQEDANVEKAKSNSASENIDSAKDAEKEGPWKNKVTGRGVYGDNPFERGRKLSATNVKSILKKKGPVGLIITILLGGSVGLGGLFGGALAPIAFMENVTDDLNDQLAALDIRGTAMLRNKIATTNAKESVAGCTKLSIRCKFKTMSAKQVARYERAGIHVKGESSPGIGKRIAPTSYTYRGVEMNAKDFMANMKTNTSLRVAQKTALNMKFLGLNDSSFVKRTLARFGISKRPPELKGTHQERVNALMNKAGVNDIKDVKFIPAVNDKGPILASDGKPGFYLDGDSSQTVYTEAHKLRSEATVTRVGNAQPPSRLGSNVLKGLGILGYWDLACTIKNMIGGAAVAAKIANQYELAQYAMKQLSLISQMKAGDISMENGQVVGEFFGSTDSRAKVVDLDKSVTPDLQTGKITPSAEVAMKDNPNYGMNAMDSPLYKLSSMGQFNSVSLTETQYSLGMGQNALLSGFSNFAAITDAMVNLGDAKACEFVQNWAVRGVGLIVGIVGAIFSGGGLTVAQAATSGSLIIASLLLETIINNALSGSILAAGMSEAPLDRAAAVWTGTAGILSESAKNRGMIPGNADQIMAYNNLQIESKNDYIAVEKANAHPFDINNQYSFLGALGRSMLPYINSADNVQSTFGSVMSFTTNSINKAFIPLSTYAATIDPARFKKCDDQGYDKMNIDADVQCNVRYIMPLEDLKLDTDDVAKYMEDNGYVEKDTTSGLPIGYTPPIPSESQGFAMDMLNGVINSYFDTRAYGEGKGAEYGKFLDYCAYRILPYGETYQESGQANSVDPIGTPDGYKWLDGSRCLRADDPVISNFRIYTLDKTLSEAEDEDEIETPTGVPTVGDPNLPPGENSGIINPGGWTFPTSPGATLASPFGPRGGGYHTGIDMSVGTGSPFYATKDGVVQTREYSVYSIAGGLWCPVLGSMTDPIQKDIWITHNVDGVTYTSVYAHMSRFLKKTGDVVKAGDLIGYTGGSGCSSGPHVHFEIWEGRANPSVPGPGMRDPWPLIKP